MRIWGAVILVAILNAAVISDFITDKIRNGLILIGLFLGLVYQIVENGGPGIGIYTGGVLFSLVFMLPLFAFGAVGAGDGKLLAVVGGFLGMEMIPKCVVFTILFGAVQAAWKMIWQKSLARRLSCLLGYVEECLRMQRFRPYGQALYEEEAVIHLSAAILFASLICLMGGVK